MGYFSMFLGMQYHEYRIEFINEFGINESVSVWLGGINDRIFEFEKCLDYYATNAVIEHFTSTFGH
ncbi:hypothetical protein H2O64_17530 [Kordia sp. YSTF-M3]|uniref:Uncharacterized protein n=1 Tax=Kordia aestuariivivens TaxID=2759037 RepID=A0ABR7QD37_9FLAO|nr:hypothetical protein [Kordia aestuariivivens]MBC8756479.1 hypothetical protein [Kordia aestuariivivens]